MGFNKLVISKTSTYILEIDERKNRAYLTLFGFWQVKTDIENYINDIQTGLERMSNNFTLLVDLTQYNGTTPEFQYLHIETQRMAINKGLSRIAEIFASNPIIKIFFETYAKESGANTMSFSNIDHAERWLDLY